MSDVSCPYCGMEQEINHDDGYGYEEDGDFEQDCINCNEPFKFKTAIMFLHTAYCYGKDDLNHDLKKEEGYNHYQCTKCDYYCGESEALAKLEVK